MRTYRWDTSKNFERSNISTEFQYVHLQGRGSLVYVGSDKRIILKGISIRV